MLKVAITGGIGSGKSTVLKEIENHDFKVLRADELAKEVYKREDFIKKAEEKGFLRDIFGDKKRIEDVVFGERRNEFLEILYEYMKEVREDIFFKAEKDGEKAIFYESSLIFEAKIEGEFDFIVLVYANEGIRVKRVMERGIGREKIYTIMRYQIPDEEKLKMVDYVIFNEGSLEDLREEVINLLKTLHLF